MAWGITGAKEEDFQQTAAEGGDKNVTGHTGRRATG
jgi:hypothetical protein